MKSNSPITAFFWIVSGLRTIHELVWFGGYKGVCRTDFGPYQIDALSQLAAPEERDPKSWPAISVTLKGGIEGTEDSDESAAAIGGNHRHDVDVVAEETPRLQRVRRPSP